MHSEKNPWIDTYFFVDYISFIITRNFPLWFVHFPSKTEKFPQSNVKIPRNPQTAFSSNPWCFPTILLLSTFREKETQFLRMSFHLQNTKHSRIKANNQKTAIPSNNSKISSNHMRVQYLSASNIYDFLTKLFLRVYIQVAKMIFKYFMKLKMFLQYLTKNLKLQKAK